MKHRISFTLEEDTVFAIQEALRKNRRKGIFTNKSRLIEYSVKNFLNGGDGFSPGPSRNPAQGDRHG
ncbi:hypothetical protein HYV84_02145 [Candidatus Woesearchaeota archaeon]|nr:hypothetical protein [Candidatus Woesearchaeota archaeon]